MLRPNWLHKKLGCGSISGIEGDASAHLAAVFAGTMKV